MQNTSMAFDSVTHLPPHVRGRAVLTGSHGGLYAASCAARAGVAAVILHDAGIGREQAGIAGVRKLDELRMPAAAVSHRSARIGDGADCLRRGVISFVNEAAASAGVFVEQHAAHALALLDACERSQVASAITAEEAQHCVERYDDISVIALDSNSLVAAEHGRAIVLTGSHGGLLGRRAETAIGHRVLAAAYNDADVGIDDAGISRLAVLDARGICAFTVSAWSARIGSGRSTYEEGFVTHVNALARRCGVEPGLAARTVVARLISAFATQKALTSQ